MSIVTLSVPDSARLALSPPSEALAGEVALLAAIKLYELGRLSSGAAAEFAGVPKPVFMARLGQYGVSAFRQTEQELDDEIANA